MAGMSAAPAHAGAEFLTSQVSSLCLWFTIRNKRQRNFAQKQAKAQQLWL